MSECGLKSIWNQFPGAKSRARPCVSGTSKVRESCDLCNASVQTGDEGFLVCTNPKCGVLFKDCLDASPEWRFYNGESGGSDPTRAGPPINPLLHDSSFGCRVLCPHMGSYEMRKIRRYTEWQAMPYREKALYDEFLRIGALARQAGLPKMVIDEAFRHHKRLSGERTFRGSNRDGIVAASLYIACRANRCPRTAKEIAGIFRLDNSAATRGCKNAVSILNDMESRGGGEPYVRLCEVAPSAFIHRYCSKLGLPSRITKLAEFIAIRIQRNSLIPENTPHAIAAGTIFFVLSNTNLVQGGHFSVSKKDIHRISDISEVTINKCYKKLLTMLEIVLPTQFRCQ